MEKRDRKIVLYHKQKREIEKLNNRIYKLEAKVDTLEDILLDLCRCGKL